METTQSAQTPSATPVAKRSLRRKVRVEGRKKRAMKLKTDGEFAKAYFAAKSKRSSDKKSAFRKKKSRKKA